MGTLDYTQLGGAGVVKKVIWKVIQVGVPSYTYTLTGDDVLTNWENAVVLAQATNYETSGFPHTNNTMVRVKLTSNNQVVFEKQNDNSFEDPNVAITIIEFDDAAINRIQRIDTEIGTAGQDNSIRHSNIQQVADISKTWVVSSAKTSISSTNPNMYIYFAKINSSNHAILEEICRGISTNQIDNYAGHIQIVEFA